MSCFARGSSFPQDALGRLCWSEQASQQRDSWAPGAPSQGKGHGAPAVETTKGHTQGPFLIPHGGKGSQEEEEGRGSRKKRERKRRKRWRRRN